MIEEIIKKLKAKGYNAEKTITIKNGVKKPGIIIGDGKVRPIIHLDSILDNKDIDDIVANIIFNYNEGMKINIDVSLITKWDYAKNNLRLCLQKKSDEDIIKKDFLDMEMYVRVVTSNESSYKIKKGMFDVSEEEIFDRALSNIKNELLLEDMLEMFIKMGVPLNFEEYGPKMLVISNKDKLYGAAAICDKELLKEIADKYNSNLVILPSSIHECIIHFDNNPILDHYDDMVRDVNATELKPEEILSDHAYYFDRETLTLS